MKATLYLSKHAFFCLADNHYVFLDLRTDEYLCLGRAHTAAIMGLLAGNNLVHESSDNVQLGDTNDSDAMLVVQALLEKGLLVENVAYGKRPMPLDVNAPTASLTTNSEKHRPRIRPAYAWRFFVAAATASKDLRWASIERIVRAVEARKSATAATIDYGATADLFAIFQTLRPYYPRPYLCLFDSLALLHFLAPFGIFPQWVYGVKLEPFAAHCWVQAGDLVVNDIIDNVHEYTPIMSV